MQEIKNVRGCVNPLPIEYGKDTVYVRSNIHNIEDEQGNVQAEFDLKMYSYPEWVERQAGDIDDINDALIELAGIIGG